jgi:DNA (cytosine-5)-methyltransferase 1
MTHDVAGPSVASLGSKPLTFGSLFAGIGGFDLGLERAGMRCEWQVEIDPYARAVLAKHWPDVRRHEDVRTFPPQEGEWGVDVICGGFPCQDISVAGKGAGLAGARSGLWYEYARIIGELRPRYVIVENVAALLARGMGTVLGDLSTLGYDAEWHVIPASAVGAPHRRERVWIVAHAVSSRAGSESREVDQQRTWRPGSALRQGNGPAGADWLEPASATEADVPDAIGLADAVRGDGPPCKEGVVRRDCNAGGSQCDCGTRCAGQAGQGACNVADSECRKGCERDESSVFWGRKDEAKQTGLGGRKSGLSSDWWAAEPDVGRVAHGVPARVDRLRCLGNAVVPQIVEVIGRAIVEAA